tara:strand:+ start:4432 stop:4617 length:186 start_codon:yes stop_codon:yes gene_type:complete
MLKALRKWFQNFKCKFKATFCKTEASCLNVKEKDRPYKEFKCEKCLLKKPLDKYLTSQAFD